MNKSCKSVLERSRNYYSTLTDNLVKMLPVQYDHCHEILRIYDRR